MKNSQHLLTLRIQRIQKQCDLDMDAVIKKFENAGDDQVEDMKKEVSEVLERLQRDMHEIHVDAHKQRLCPCTKVIEP